MTAGVTSAGLTPATIEEIVTDVTNDLRGPDGIDPTIDLSPAQPLGQIIGSFAKQLAEAWEVLQTVSNALNPNAAEGTLLENVASITGTKRDGATKSRVTALLTLGSSKTVPAGSLAAVNGQPSNQWILLGPPDAHGNPVAGPVVSTSAGSYAGVFEALVTGPQVANAGTLTTIVTPVTGWTAITNVLDAVLGQTTESDTHLRQKRRQELAAEGGCTPDAIRAKLLKLQNADGSGMIEARVYENTLRPFAYDSDSRPPGAIEAVIFDGVVPACADQDIAAVIWQNKPGGTPLYGFTTTATYKDASGVTWPVPFTRATVVGVSVAITIQIDASLFPSDGVTQIKNAIVAKGLASIHVGSTVYPLTYQAAVLSAVPGIANITAYLHGRTATTGATLTTPLTASTREIFDFDTSHITVTIV